MFEPLSWFIDLFFDIFLSFNVTAPGGKRARQIKPCFAFIWSAQRELLRKDDRNIGEQDQMRIKQLQKISLTAHGSGVYNNLVHLCLRVKQNLVPQGSILSVDKPVKMRFLSRIRPELRKFTAMLELPQSRLFESIINPSRDLVTVRNVGTNLHANIQSVPVLSRLNQSQKEIIVGVSQAKIINTERLYNYNYIYFIAPT